MTLLFTLHHRNKENVPSSLNGTTAPPTRCLRDTTNNPYSKNYCKPLQKQLDSRLASTAGPKTTSVLATMTLTAKPTSSATAVASAHINEDSPTIKRILAATGYVSVGEFLALVSMLVRMERRPPMPLRLLLPMAPRLLLRMEQSLLQMDPRLLQMELRIEPRLRMDPRRRRIPKRKPKVSTFIDTLVALDFKIMSLTQFFHTIDSFQGIQVFCC